MEKRLWLASTAALIILGISQTACSTTGSAPAAAQPTQAPVALTRTFGEPYRPSYHFTPPKAWMNDPNGMVYYKGLYHLFYQHYPEGNTWGPMSWGHAVSKDMVHWEDRPIALAPDQHGLIFSGSAVVDWNNTSGLGTKTNPPLVAIYTYDNGELKKAGLPGQSQGIAFSVDDGKTWNKYEGNPVLPPPASKPDFRDPKVIWHDASKSWVMALAVGDQTEFYTSPDLKTWTYASAFGRGIGAHGGVWECPDLVPFKVKGTGETKWVLIQSLNPGGANSGAGTQYFVGDFDGREFKMDQKFTAQLQAQGPQWLDWGRDNYAAVTWSDISKTDGRVLSIGWMNNWDYAEKIPPTAWRGANTLPRELTLHDTGNGYSLRSNPVAEVSKLHGKTHVTQPQRVTESLSANIPADQVMRSAITLEFAKVDGAIAYLEFSNDQGETYQVGLDGKSQKYFSDRRKSGRIDFSEKFASAVHTAPRTSTADTVKMRVYTDSASVELFADDGATVMTDTVFPLHPYTKVKFVVNGQPVSVSKLEAIDIKSIW
ncbi:glycoside hydrolase family 32 protein [Asticcacaulis sp.]|uniref:glycoside hydrolase family 32 protein n=1 Tax=Asticcacaulis sp. TaxID=1872648 RepID=UPI0031E29734